MKIHRVIVSEIVEALVDIFETGYHADKVISYRLKKNKKWGSRDRRFFAEAVYDIVRWWRLLWGRIDQSPNLSEEKLHIVLAVWLKDKGLDVPSWLQGTEVKTKDVEKLDLSVQHSFPEWLYKKCEAELGKDWESLAESLNKPAEVVLRANAKLISKEKLIEAMANEGIECVPVDLCEHGVKLIKRQNVFQTKSFKRGFFEVQDAASQCVAPLLDVKPGQRVIDACAGAGGKSLHLASLMEDKGKILSLDIHDYKLEQAKKRARRNKYSIIETRQIKGSKTIKRLKETADRLLLDVPCSGLGVLRRNPDTKWKLSEQMIDEVNKTQSEILFNYSSMLKPGGKLVYATCSVLPSENQKVVDRFLESEKGWKQLDSKNWRPDKDGFDGFYAAVLERAD